MAQPTPYTRQFNFSDFQTTSPSDPLPATQVENELNSLLTNLAGLNQNIGLLQRDDGKLKNQSVHKSSFDSDSLALMGLSGFTVKGNWASSTAYLIGDIVDFNNATYLSTENHTSSTAFATDLSADKWILLANGALGNVGTSVDKFEGNGVLQQFNLTQTYSSTTEIMVFVNGALKNPDDDYTISGSPSVLNLSSPPSSPAVAGNENVIVFGTSVLVMAAKNAAETASSNASGFATNSATSATKSENYAVKVNGAVPSTTDHSSKAWAVGGTGVTNTSNKGASKEWATTTGSTVDTSEYSSKEYAIGTTVAVGSSKDWATQTSGAVDSSEYSAKEYAQGTQASTGGSAKSWAQDADQVNGAGTNDRSAKAWSQGSNMTGATLGGSAKDWAQHTGSTVDGTNYSAKYWATQGNVGIVAGLEGNINILAPIASDITDVANDASDIGAVANKEAEIGILAGGSHLSNIAILAGANLSGGTVRADIETLVPRATDIGTLAPKAGAIQQVSNVSSDVTTVAHLEDGTTATNAISTLANRNSDIQALAPTASDMQTLSPKVTEIGRLGATAGNITSLNNLGTVDAVADMNTLASISSDITSLAGALEKTYTVTVANVGSQAMFHLNGSIANISVFRGNTYIFNQDASSNNNHPLGFVNGATAYDVGVTYTIDGSTVTKSQYTNTTTFNAGTTRSVTLEVDTSAPASGLAITCLVHGTAMGLAIATTDSNISLVANGMTNINTTATNIGAVNNVSTNMSDVTNVHNNMSDVNALNATGVLTNINTLATGQTGGLSNLGSIALINTGSNMANITTVSTNINSVNDFAEKYRIGSNDPSTSLNTGDLFYNSTSNTLKVYTGSAWEAGVTAGSGFAALSGSTFTGDVTFTGDSYNLVWDKSDNALEFGTLAKATFGASNALEIFTNDNTGHSYIVENGTGSLIINANEAYIQRGGSTKLNTTSTGINITGVLTTDGATHDGDVTFTGSNYHAMWDKSQNSLEFNDGARATFGSSRDLQLRHDGSASFIENYTGNLDIYSYGNDTRVNIYSDDGSGGTAKYFTADGYTGRAKMYYYGTLKLSTVSTGVDVTGVLTTDGATHDGDVTLTGANANVEWDKSADIFRINDNGYITIGSNNDLYFQHDSNNSVITNQTGHLTIENTANDKDIILKSDDSSGGTTNYVFCDGSKGEVKLYHYGSSKLTTKSTGVTVSGKTTTTSLNINGTDVTASATELNQLDGFTGDTTDLNRLDMGTGEQLGIFKVSNSVPTQASDFTNNTKLIMVY